MRKQQLAVLTAAFLVAGWLATGCKPSNDGAPAAAASTHPTAQAVVDSPRTRDSTGTDTTPMAVKAPLRNATAKK